MHLSLSLSLISLTHTHTHTYHRGLLAGKFERGVKPDDPNSSRVAWVEADSQSRTNQSHPSLSQYSDDDQYWDLIQKMKEIAASHGIFHCASSKDASFFLSFRC